MTLVWCFDEGRRKPGRLVQQGDRLRVLDAPDGHPTTDAVVTGRFTDHHVHLQLVDAAGLADSLLGSVTDLGAAPDAIRDLAHALAGRCTVRFAGAFLTAPGGYPSDRAWAPTGSVYEVADAAAAAEAVRALHEDGASCVKVVAHSEAGPVLSDDCFRAVVATAAERGMPVVAHAEGHGQAQRAVRLGATRLAHTPFTELLDDAEIAYQAANAVWISTLAIHEGTARATAVDNLRRFAAAGGTVLYGTDMGNGELPVDLHPGELAALREAGVHGTALLAALTPAAVWGNDDLLVLPSGDPSLARPLTLSDLEA